MGLRAAAAPSVAGLAVALLVFSLIPVAPRATILPILTHGMLVAFLAIVSLPLVTAALATRRAPMPDILDTLLLLAGCGVAMTASLAAVAMTAESLQADNIVLAQQYTKLFVVRLPVAASAALVAAALAGRRTGTDARPRAARVATLLLDIAGATLIATAFLGGFSGPRLPGIVWVALKSASVLAVVLLLRRWMRDASARGLAIAWGAAVAAILSLLFTLRPPAP